MSTIAGRQRAACFKQKTPICGNCIHEERKHDAEKNRTERSCSKHAIFVLMSSTCDAHAYRPRGAQHAVAKR